MIAPMATRRGPAPVPAPAKSRVFRGRNLPRIAFPLGGIGTGNVSLAGDGHLLDWELFNKPSKGLLLTDTCFAVWAKPEGRPPAALIAEAAAQPPFEGAGGFKDRAVPGLPRFADASFSATYPFARIQFGDPGFPLKVSVEAFTPFIPLNDLDSGLPCAIFLWTLTNPGRRRAEAAIAYSQLNPVGLDGTEHVVTSRNAAFGGNRNELVHDKHVWAVHLTSDRYAKEDVRHGSMAAGVLWPRVSAVTRWPATGGWGWMDTMGVWREFAATGRVPGPAEPTVSADGRTETATISALMELEPGESLTVPFIVAWHFPNRVNDWNPEPEVRGRILRNHYASWLPDAPAVLAYTVREFDRLQRESRTFERGFWSSTLPAEVLESVGNQVATLRTPTCFRDEEGRLFGFEGCGRGYDECSDRVGCCPLNCTHVWNYAQAPAYLFPELERSMRTTDFQVNTRPGGEMAFRTLVPIAAKVLWNFKPAADGQMGTIMRLYRDWQLCGDEEFLRSSWPKAKEALEFAWRQWDADRDGVMEGEQHNTYDIEFHGPNPLTTILYLGALRAGEEMALAAGDGEAAGTFRKVFDQGSRKAAEALWNGEYFVQTGDADAKPHQHGVGCLTDQLLGQWMAHQSGLGHLVPAEKSRRAAAAIHRYNFRKRLGGHANTARVYAAADEGGLLLCTWPKGGRPKAAFPYADEVWTGIEYAAAALMIQEGLTDEGLEIVRAVRARHDGERRNPFNEPECGNHYARGMASWSLLTALSGFRWSAPNADLRFVPGLPGKKFSCFFSTGTAWGTLEQGLVGKKGLVTITVAGGTLRLRRLRLAPSFTRLDRVWAEPARTFLRGMFDRRKTESLVEFPSGVDLVSGQALALTLG